MALEKKRSGTARQKRNCWSRGNGVYSMRGELKRGLSRNKKRLNRMVRHRTNARLQSADYKKVCKTLQMVDFT